MQTVELNIKDGKLDLFLTIIENLKEDIVENIVIKDQLLDIQALKNDDIDYIDLQNTKSQKNQKYNLNEAKELLNL